MEHTSVVPSGITHIHIGPSPLGLGLIVEITKSLGFEIHLVGKAGAPAAPYYGATVFRRDGTHDYKERQLVASHTTPSADLPLDVTDALRAAGAVLITITLRDRCAERAPFIRALIERADPNVPIALAMCENTITNDHQSLIESLPGRVLVLETIVDRVCTWPELASAAPDPRHVVHHEIGEWIIRDPGEPHPVLASLSESPDVQVVDGSLFIAFRDRKDWLVNGLHLDAAIRGRAHSQPNLRALVDNPELLSGVQATLAMMAEAYERRHGRSVEPAWALDRLQVVSQLPDSADRVLKTVRREDIAPFLKSFERRIAVPARIVGRDLGPVARMLVSDLTEILVDLEQYDGWQDLRSGDLDGQRDRHAVKAYETALRGWVPADQIERGATRLAKQLSRHRRQLG